MTCVVGIAHHGRVILGSDSSIVGDDHDIGACADSKVFKRDGVGFGFAGEFTAYDLLRYHVEIPEFCAPAERWLRRELVPQVRKAATENDVDWSKSHALVAVDGRLFFLEDNFSVIEPAPLSRDGRRVEHYASIGTGSAWASAILWGEDRDGNLTLRQQAEKALMCAAAKCVEVCPPFRFVEL